MENILVNPAFDKAKKAVQDISQKTIRKTQNNLVHYANEPESVIRKRVEQLDKEWDMERALEVEGSVLTLTGLLLGSKVNKRWLLLPGFVAGFMAMRAITGWCLPSAIFRASGVRNRQEIDKEKYGLLEILRLRKQNTMG